VTRSKYGSKPCLQLQLNASRPRRARLDLYTFQPDDRISRFRTYPLVCRHASEGRQARPRTRAACKSVCLSVCLSLSLSLSLSVCLSLSPSRSLFSLSRALSFCLSAFLCLSLSLSLSVSITLCRCLCLCLSRLRERPENFARQARGAAPRWPARAGRQGVTERLVPHAETPAQARFAPEVIDRDRSLLRIRSSPGAFLGSSATAALALRVALRA
jgi:hypothetical protein